MIGSSAGNLSGSKDKRRLAAERAAVKAREKEHLDRQQLALRRQKEFREKTLVWNEQVLPRWEACTGGQGVQAPGTGDLASNLRHGSFRSKVRDLCHKGIPPNIRGKVWPLMIGNELRIDAEQFEALNRKVVRLYGSSNLSAAKCDQETTPQYPVYRDEQQQGQSTRGSGLGAGAATRGMGVQGGQGRLGDSPGQGKGGQLYSLRDPGENERNGSLDEEAFAFVQRQLFQGADRARELAEWEQMEIEAEREREEEGEE
ncbi:hypothetical protein B484DRAFT_398745, partial [Ochromonadaceae sp. CCMP2298]